MEWILEVQLRRMVKDFLHKEQTPAIPVQPFSVLSFDAQYWHFLQEPNKFFDMSLSFFLAQPWHCCNFKDILGKEVTRDAMGSPKEIDNQLDDYCFLFSVKFQTDTLLKYQATNQTKDVHLSSVILP